MKQILYLLIFLPLFATSQVKVSELSSATSVGASDYFLLIQGGSSKKVPYSVFRYNASNAASQINDSLAILRPAISSEISDSISAITAGTSISFGSQYQIPTTNATTDDFNYSSNLKWDGTTFTVNSSTGSNLSIGLAAGDATTGSQNTFVGYNSGTDNTTGNYNTFFGTLSGQNATSASGNTLIGYRSGDKITTSGANTFLGFRTGYNNTASNNVFIGYESGYSNTTGQLNSLVGTYSGYNNTTGSQNTFFGYQTGNQNTDGEQNTFLGYRAGYLNVGGDYNLYSGVEAGYSATTGNYNTILGYKTGRGNTTGYENTFLGSNSGYSNATGYRNVYLGNYAGYNSTGNYNVFLGYQAGQNETGSNKLYISNNATDTLIYGEFDTDSLHFNADVSIDGNIYADNLTPISGNEGEITYINSAGTGETTSANLTWNGKGVELNYGTGNYLTGVDAGNSFTSGIYNTSCGYLSSSTITSGGLNVMIGNNTSVTTGSKNVLVGSFAGDNITTTSNNTILGHSAGRTNTGAGNIFIGHEAAYNETGSNKLYIENSNIATPLIYGEFDNDYLKFNADSVTFAGTIKTEQVISKTKAHGFFAFEDSAVVVDCTQNVWVQVTNATNTLFTAVQEGQGFDISGDTITFNEAAQGDLNPHIVLHWGVDGYAAVNEDYELRIYNIDNTAGVKRKAEGTTTGSTNRIEIGSTSYDVSSSFGDRYILQIMNKTNSNDFTIENGSIYLEVSHY